MKRQALAMATALLAASAASGARDLVIMPHCEGPEHALSRVTVGTRTLPWSDDEENLARLKAALGDRARTVRIVVDRHVPYRCIGGLIFTLQRLGVARTAFIAEPKPQSEERP